MKIKHSSSSINEKDYKYIKRALGNNFVGEGNITILLEKKLATYTRRKYCKVVNNGSNALLLALLVLKKEFPDKNKVITSSYICPAVINSILQANLMPVLADIDSNNLNINIGSVFDKINNNTLTIIIPHLAGIPVNLNKIEDVNISIINDCAQAIGSKINNNPVGYYGDFCIYSFGSTKMITGGIGGAILTNNIRYFRIIKELISYEKTPSYYTKYGFDMSYNMELSDISAGLVIAQFNRLDDIISKRRKIADEYDCLLRNKKDVDIISENKNQFFNRYRYYFFSDQVNEYYNLLREKGIDARKSIAHIIPKYFKTEQPKNLSYLSNRVISLPIYPSLNNKDLSIILNSLRKI